MEKTDVITYLKKRLKEYKKKYREAKKIKNN